VQSLLLRGEVPQLVDLRQLYVVAGGRAAFSLPDFSSSAEFVLVLSDSSRSAIDRQVAL
jgi:hypothetical protein